MNEVKRFLATISDENLEGSGIYGIAFTERPVIEQIGVAMCKDEEIKEFFALEEKMQIVAPLMKVGIFARPAKNGFEPYEMEFTAESIQKILIHLMKKPKILENLFNLNHSDKKINANLIEVWTVENPETDKSFTEYGVKGTKGDVFIKTQINDKDQFEALKKQGSTGFSIEANFKKRKESMSEILTFELEGKKYQLIDDKPVLVEEMAEEKPNEEKPNKEMAEQKEEVQEVQEVEKVEEIEEKPLTKEEIESLISEKFTAEMETFKEMILKELADQKNDTLSLVEEKEEFAKLQKAPKIDSIDQRFANLFKFKK